MQSASNRIVAKLYAPLGTVELSDDQPLRVLLDESPPWLSEVRESVASINKDVADGVVLVVEGTEHTIRAPVGRLDLSALAAAIQGRTRGRLVMLNVPAAIQPLAATAGQ